MLHQARYSERRDRLTRETREHNSQPLLMAASKGRGSIRGCGGFTFKKYISDAHYWSQFSIQGRCTVYDTAETVKSLGGRNGVGALEQGWERKENETAQSLKLIASGHNTHKQGGRFGIIEPTHCKNRARALPMGYIGQH